MQEEPVQEKPVREELAQLEPAQDESAQEEPVQEEPAQEEPTQEEPAQEEPTQEEPAQEEPAREATTQEAPEDWEVSEIYPADNAGEYAAQLCRAKALTPEQLVHEAVLLMEEDRHAEAVALLDTVRKAPKADLAQETLYNGYVLGADLPVGRPGWLNRTNNALVKLQSQVSDRTGPLRSLQEAMLVSAALQALLFPEMAYDYDLYNTGSFYVSTELSADFPAESAVLKRIMEKSINTEKEKKSESREKCSVDDQSNRSDVNQHGDNVSKATKPKGTDKPVSTGGFWEGVKRVVKNAGDFVAEHKEEIGLGALAILGTVAEIAINSNNDSDDEGIGVSHEGFGDYSYSSFTDDCELPDSFSVPDEREYPETHASPQEHTVPGHGQHYHTKDGVIWKEKEAYTRGGKHPDEE